jgi:hypothetical protein
MCRTCVALVSLLCRIFVSLCRETQTDTKPCRTYCFCCITYSETSDFEDLKLNKKKLKMSKSKSKLPRCVTLMVIDDEFNNATSDRKNYNNSYINYPIEKLDLVLERGFFFSSN